VSVVVVIDSEVIEIDVSVDLLTNILGLSVDIFTTKDLHLGYPTLFWRLRFCEFFVRFLWFGSSR